MNKFKNKNNHHFILTDTEFGVFYFRIFPFLKNKIQCKNAKRILTCSPSESSCDVDCSLELTVPAQTAADFLCDTKSSSAGSELQPGVQCDGWAQTKVTP